MLYAFEVVDFLDLVKFLLFYHLSRARPYSNNERMKNEEKETKIKTKIFGRNHTESYVFYIAGYTSGGAPYGVTWEEMGLEPYERID